jgi:hypothetical protein
MEMSAKRRLLEMLPCELKPDDESLFFAREDDAQHWELARAADRLARAGPTPTGSAAEVTGGLGRLCGVFWLGPASSAGSFGGTWGA